MAEAVLGNPCGEGLAIYLPHRPISAGCFQGIVASDLQSPADLDPSIETLGAADGLSTFNAGPDSPRLKKLGGGRGTLDGLDVDVVELERRQGDRAGRLVVVEQFYAEYLWAALTWGR